MSRGTRYTLDPRTTPRTVRCSNPGGSPAALVALLRGRVRPWSHYADLVEEAGSAVTVLEAERGAKAEPLFEAEEPSDLGAIAAEIEACGRSVFK